MFDCMLFAVTIKDLPLAFQSQRNLILKRLFQHNGDMFSISRRFPQSIRFTNDYSILALEAICFSQDLLQT